MTIGHVVVCHNGARFWLRILHSWLRFFHKGRNTIRPRHARSPDSGISASLQQAWIKKIHTAAKRHKIHKNNNLHIGILNSYGHQKHEFGLFTSLSRLLPFHQTIIPPLPISAQGCFG